MNLNTPSYKVSVIIPVYNVATYLEKAVHSLFAQTLKGIEFIFVDDCSTDESFTILSTLIAQYPTLTNNIQAVRHTQNKGVATARNTGLSLATGKYLGAVDPDDWVESDMFEKLFVLAEEKRAEIVWCDYYNSYPHCEIYVPQKIAESPNSCIDAMLRGKLLGGMCTKLVSHHLFLENNIRYPDGLNMCEDLRVSVQLFYYAKTVAHLEDANYHYIKHRTDSISTTNDDQPIIKNDWITNVQAIETFLLEKDCQEFNESIQLLKLIPKQNLLVRGNNIQHFKMWRNLLPESNSFITKGDLPIHYKIIANCIINNQWLLPRIWLFLKKIKGSK